MNIFANLFKSLLTNKNKNEAESKTESSKQPLKRPEYYCYQTKSKDELVFGKFPTIDIHMRPSRQEFKEIKREFVEKAFLAVSEHYHYVIENDYLIAKKEIQDIIKVSIKQFIEFFWDLPASENVNYTEPFGLLKKSLKDACARADRAENLNVCSDDGTISSERTRVCRPYFILVEFMLGLFGNSSTIFNTKMTSIKNGKIHTFYPFWGSLLNFKMVFQDVDIDWINSHNDVRLNYILLIYLTPFSFIQVLPDEVRQYFLDEFVSNGIMSEKKETLFIKNHKIQEKLNYIQHELSAIYKGTPEIIDVPYSSNIFRVSKNYYVVCEKEFINLISRITSYDKEEILDFLRKSKLAIFNGDTYSIKVRFYYSSDIKEINPRKPSINSLEETFIFIKNDFFKPILHNIEKNVDEYIEPTICFDISASLAIQEFLGKDNPKIPSRNFYDPDKSQQQRNSKDTKDKESNTRTKDREENRQSGSRPQKRDKDMPGDPGNQTLSGRNQNTSPNQDVEIPQNIFGKEIHLDTDNLHIINQEKAAKKIASQNKKQIQKKQQDEKNNQNKSFNKHEILEKNINDFFQSLDEGNTLIQSSQKNNNRNVGFLSTSNELFIYLRSIIKACYKQGPCPKNITQTILSWLYDNEIISDINGLFFQKITVEYYTIPKDQLDVPEMKTIEAHFVKMNLNAIKNYHFIYEQIMEFLETNKRMNM